LFDLDGTLYDRDRLVADLFEAQIDAFASDLAGVPRDAFLRALLEMDDHGYGEKAAGYARVMRAFDRPDALASRFLAHFWRAYDAHCRPQQETIDVLQALRSRGMKLALVTNGTEARQRGKIRALGLEEAFDAILISEAEGVRKPDAEIFRRAVAHCGVEAREAAFVGDHPRVDIEGAIGAGLMPIWKSVPYWEPVPGVAAVETLAEILALYGAASSLDTRSSPP
jgi:putative hydrolase of the HAD superfamily